MSASPPINTEAAAVFFALEPRLNDLRRLCWAAKCVAENGQDHQKDMESLVTVIDRAWMEADAIQSAWTRLFNATGRAT